jgi:sensor domain CHASE-containing protein
MSKKSILTFFICFTFFYFSLNSFFKKQTKQREATDAEQTSIIQENVKDRFKIFLNLPLTVSLMGADYFSTGDLKTKDYGPFTKKLFEINKEFLGLNMVNTEGLIIRVHPPENNTGTLGKFTQNRIPLKKSFRHKDSFWFSPPFRLLQGKDGFVFYVPIMRENKLRGWFASVIDTEHFIEKFKLSEYLKSYELIIKDHESGLNYYASATTPDTQKKIYESEMELYGRKILFQSWRKDPTAFIHLPWYINFLIAIILALIGALTTRLYEQKKKAKNQLESISVLLRLTSKEALSNLVDMHDEFLKTVEVSQGVTYLTKLLEQIDLLQTMAHTKEGIHQESLPFLPLLEEQIEELKEITSKKNLTITIHTESFANFMINTNGWLLQHSVLNNILSHSIIHAQIGSAIHIEHKSSEELHFIEFRTLKVIHSGQDSLAIKFDRRMEVAKQVLHIYQGELFIQRDLSEGIIVRMLIPNF